MTVSAPQIGKSVTLGLWLLAGAWMDGGRVNAPSWIVAPTFEQVKDRFMRYIVAFARGAGILEGHTESTPLRAKLTNGSVIEARSWDHHEGLYGSTVARIGVDEFGFLTREAWAALSSRVSETALRGLGYIRMVGNVTEIGGIAEELYRLGESDAPGYKSRTWTWRDRALAASCSCGNGTPAPCEVEHADKHAVECQRGMYLRELRARKSEMSESHFRQLYGAEWIDWSALPAYTFERAVNVKDELAAYRPGLPIDLSCDFNVDPMCWVVGQHYGADAWAFDEIVIPGGATTEQAAREFVSRYPAPKDGDRRFAVVNVYGDASGNSKSTKSKSSDYDIIRRVIGEGRRDLAMHVPTANPPVSSRLNAVNAKLRSADGTIGYYLHSRCTVGANDLARVSLKPGTREIDKRNKSLTHWSDADGYRIAVLYPVEAGRAAVAVSVPSPTYHDAIMGMDS